MEMTLEDLQALVRMLERDEITDIEYAMAKVIYFNQYGIYLVEEGG